jgi:hypothetical protein
MLQNIEAHYCTQTQQTSLSELFKKLRFVKEGSLLYPQNQFIKQMTVAELFMKLPNVTEHKSSLLYTQNHQTSGFFTSSKVKEYVELYLHSPIRLHGVVLSLENAQGHLYLYKEEPRIVHG